MARLYANENFPLPVVESLRQLGHEVLTIQEAGKSGQAMPDREVLAFAASHGMALVTLNRKHFIRLHASIRITRGSSFAHSIRTSSGRHSGSKN